MKMDFGFFLNSILFGVGLAMDAFSVSVANGLNDPKMNVKKQLTISAVFGFFQFVMPLIGWICVHTILNLFSSLEKFIPWIALILLGYIGGKMIYEGIKGEEADANTSLAFGALIVQGIATSIDALSVGFTIANYDFSMALTESLIIGIITFALCMLGIKIGKAVGNKFSSKASVLGGVILIIIGLEILIKSFVK